MSTDSGFNTDSVVVSSGSYKIKAIGCIILTVSLAVQVLTGPGLKPTSFEPLLFVMLLFLSLYFSFFVDLKLINEKQIELSSLWKRSIPFERILQFKFLPIYSRQQGNTSGIYKIKYLDRKNRTRTRLVSIPERNLVFIDVINKCISN